MNTLPAVLASILTVCVAYLTAPLINSLAGMPDAIAMLVIFAWIVGHGVIWFVCAHLLSRIFGVR